MSIVRISSRVAIVGVLAGAVGCFKPNAAEEPKPSAASEPSAGPLKVRSDGACLQLGELQQPTVTANAFVGKVSELLAAGRRESARRYVARFPDVAEDLLRTCDPARANDPAVQFIAATNDRLCGGDFWQPWLRDLPGPNRGYAAKRGEAAAELRAGRPEPVVSAHLPGTAGANPLLALDALRLHGQALLLTNKAKEAATAFEGAAKHAVGDYHQTAQCLLLQGEAQRRAGQPAEAKATWTQAVAYAAQMLEGLEPHIDPGLWERAAYLKPVDANWPEGAIRAHSQLAARRVLLPGTPGATTHEAWVWITTGLARCERGELHAALTAYKRAETMTTDPSVRDGLAVAQARVLLLMGQSQPAAAILVPVIDSKTSPHAPAATALLGSMKLAAGSAEQALSLLKRAVEGSQTQWPGRAEAEADLGLAYLSVGDSQNGLRWLGAARAKFENEREHELLVRSWDNESRYWDSQGRATEAATCRENVRRIEAGATEAPALR